MREGCLFRVVGRRFVGPRLNGGRQDAWPDIEYVAANPIRCRCI